MSDPKKICDECGKIHVTHWGTAACRKHLSGTDPLEPCSRPPTKAMTVCRAHGAVGISKLKAQMKLPLMAAQGEIGELMRQCDIPEQHPVDGLLEVVRVSGAMMRMLTVKVGELKEDPELEDDVVVGEDGEVKVIRKRGLDGFWGTNHNNEMVAHPYVTLLKTWSERYEKACATALSAGVAERQIKLAENQGELLATAVGGILRALKLTPEQWAAAPKIVEAQMRQVAQLPVRQVEAS